MDRCLTKNTITVECDSLDYLLNLKEIKSLARGTEIVCLVDKWDKNLVFQAIDELDEKFNYLFTRYDEPTSSIVITKYFTKEEVLKNLYLLIDIIKDYAHDTRKLVNDLANKYQLTIDRDYPFNTFHLFRMNTPMGELDGEWSYFFHGFECKFKNRKTGQEVEVFLTFSDEFGALDAEFLGRYIRTNPRHDDFPFKICHNFHDGNIILEVMKEEGRIKKISNQVKEKQEIVNGEIAIIDRYFEGYILL